MREFALGLLCGLALGWLIYKVIVVWGMKMVGGPDAKSKAFTKDLLSRMDHDALRGFHRSVEAELERRRS